MSQSSTPDPVDSLISTPVGSRVVDCSTMEYLVDLAPGARRGLCSTQEGFPEVLAEIFSRQKLYGAIAGIPDSDLAAAVLAEQRIKAIEEILPAAKKLVEMLIETHALIDDERHRRILAIAATIDRRSRLHPELLAQYEATRTYRSAIANKAAATRRRNQADAADPGAGEPTND